MDVDGTWSIREGVVYCDGREVSLRELTRRLIEAEAWQVTASALLRKQQVVGFHRSCDCPVCDELWSLAFMPQAEGEREVSDGR